MMNLSQPPLAKFSAQAEKLLVWLLLSALALLSTLALGYAGLKLLRLSAASLFLLSCGMAATILALNYFLFRLLKNAPNTLIAFSVFLMALLPRMAFGWLAECAPVSDFANYHQFVQWFGEGDRQSVLNLSEAYQLAEFSGLAVLNYGLSLLFSPTLAGMRLASQVLSALICTVIFCLALPVHKPAAFLAALLYAWYPGSIVAAQIITNQHGATLFALLSFFPLLRAVQAKSFLPAILYAALSGILLTVSHFFHPSSVVTLLAVIFFCLVAAALAKRISALRILAALACFLLSFQMTMAGTLGLLRSQGLLSGTLHTNAGLSKIAVGLNPETSGAYSEEDYRAINAFPEEERNAQSLRLIQKRLSNPVALLKTLTAKTFSMWVRTDNLFLFYAQGVEAGRDGGTTRAETALAFAQVLQLWDALFTALLYASAALGLYAALKAPLGNTVRLLLWTTLGWAGVHILSEVQPRYRYFAFPMLAVFAGMGLSALKNRKQKGSSQA